MSLVRTNLPTPITSDIPATWAYDTMTRRVQQDIIPRVIEDNVNELNFPTSPARSECLLMLNDLIASLNSGSSGYLRGLADKGDDILIWDHILSGIPDEKRNWLNAPWLISEFYLYRRINEVFKYFETGYDMFEKQKVNGLIESIDTINDISDNFETILKGKPDKKEVLKLAILTSLWGNKMDLSLWPSHSNDSNKNDNQEEEEEDTNAAGTVSFGLDSMQSINLYILDNQINEVIDLLMTNKSPLTTIDIIVDNAGYELVSDLFLGYALIGLGITEKVVYHTKGHPTFVSDATTRDALETIQFLSELPKPAFSSANSFGNIVKQYLASGKMILDDDLYWCQPFAFWDMPNHVRDKFSNSGLIFVKGDANYRRLLGDRQWPLDTPAKDILSYWMKPMCALRTFKAEIGCGITLEAQERAFAMDSKWMVSGRWGVIQLGGPLRYESK